MVVTAQRHEEDGWEWKSAKDAAARYVALAERLPGAVQAQDPARAAAPSPTTATSHVPSSLLALDERRELRQVFGAAHVALLVERPEVGHSWWSCWLAVRLEGASACDREATGYSRARVFEVLREVDAYVLLAMAEHQARETSVSEEMDARLNATPRPRVGYAEAEVMPWDEGEEAGG
jgi:hypothetical protein